MGCQCLSMCVESGPQGRRVLLVALLGALSCTGRIGDPLSEGRPSGGVSTPDLRPPIVPPVPPPVEPPPDPDPPTAICPSVTPQRARRVSLGEYERAVIDLIGVSPGVTSFFEPDPSVHGFDNQADALFISSGNFEEFAAAAQVAAETTDVAAVAPCASDVAPEQCAASFVSSLGRRAYGRGLSDVEQEDLLALYQQGAAFDGYERGIRTVIET